jgi:hypothetical protein
MRRILPLLYVGLNGKKYLKNNKYQLKLCVVLADHVEVATQSLGGSMIKPPIRETHCRRCGRTLQNPIHIEMGIGRICRGKEKAEAGEAGLRKKIRIRKGAVVLDPNQMGLFDQLVEVEP